MGSIFGGLKIVFFRASCFGFRVKGVCLLLLPLVSLVICANSSNREACARWSTYAWCQFWKQRWKCLSFQKLSQMSSTSWNMTDHLWRILMNTKLNINKIRHFSTFFSLWESWTTFSCCYKGKKISEAIFLGLKSSFFSIISALVSKIEKINI